MFKSGEYLILASAFLIISGCATGPGGESCGLGQPGKISFAKSSSDAGTYCNVSATYTNLADVTVKPRVSYTAFDASDNTIDQSRVHFDQILPGKQQVKNAYVSGGSCAKVKKITIHQASNSTGERMEFRICGVDGKTFTW